MQRIKRIVYVIIISLLVGFFMQHAPTFAYNMVEKKALGASILKCYSDSAVVRSNIEVEDAYQLSTIIHETGRTVPLINGNSSFGSNDATISCYGLFGGSGTTMAGIASSFKTKATNDRQAISRAEAMGYESDGSNGWCINVTYQKYIGGNTGTRVSSPELCSSSGNMSDLNVATLDNKKQDTSGIYFSINKVGNSTKSIVINIPGVREVGYGRYELEVGNYATPEELGIAVRDTMGGVLVNRTFSSDPNAATYGGEVKFSGVSSYIDNLHLLGNDRVKASIHVANKLLDVNFGDKNALMFTPNEEYILYMGYLQNYYGMKIGEQIRCDYSEAEAASFGNSVRKIPILQNGSIETCYAKEPARNADKTVNGLQGFLFSDVQKSWQQLISELYSIKDELDPEGIRGSVMDDDIVNDGEDVSVCASSGAAGSLGWLLCPLLDWMSSASQGAYGFVEESLQISPILFSGGADSGIKKGWDVFQNFANIAFIIVFLAIIISQVTGFGIDNYGIKKMLPKLVVAVVLVNLSYYICVIFVDLSNIIGNSILNLFQNLPSVQTAQQIVIDGASIDVGNSLTGNLVSVGIIVALVSGIHTIKTNTAIFATVFVSALGVLTSVFFIFVLLAVRQAAVVILTAISPLALLCFVLPNTRSLFQKYLKIALALLVLYPICSLVIGGGGYASKLLLSSGFGEDGLIPAFTAMAVGIAPIFFIPGLVTSSMSGLGNIGARISSIGKTVGTGVQGATKNSDLYKGIQSGLQTRDAANKARRAEAREREMNGNSITSKVRAAMAGGRRNMVRNDARAIAQAKGLEEEDIRNYMMLVNELTRNGENLEELDSLIDKYVAENNKAGVLACVKIAGRRPDTAANFMNKHITGVGLSKEAANKMQDLINSNQEIFQSIAKEIATGENSAVFRSTVPLGFDFAAMVNRTASSSGGSVNINYSSGFVGAKNVSNAINRHITGSSSLVAMKESSLKELYEYMNDPSKSKMSDDDAKRMQKYAEEAFRNFEAHGGPWDHTKDEILHKIASWGQPGSNDSGGVRSDDAPPAMNNTKTINVKGDDKNNS